MAATILVVEDSPTDVILIRRALSQAGLTNPVQVVSDGDAAVAYLAGAGDYADRTQFPLPALVLLDLKLPRRSGLEVLEWVRAQATVRRVPVVMLTSSEQRRDVNAAYDRGVNSYLVKPVEFHDLRGLLTSVSHYWLGLNAQPGLGEAGG